VGQKRLHTERMRKWEELIWPRRTNREASITICTLLHMASLTYLPMAYWTCLAYLDSFLNPESLVN